MKEDFPFYFKGHSKLAIFLLSERRHCNMKEDFSKVIVSCSELKQLLYLKMAHYCV